MHKFTLSAPARVVGIRECAACGAKNRVPLDELRIAKCGRCRATLPPRSSGLQAVETQTETGRARR